MSTLALRLYHDRDTEVTRSRSPIDFPAVKAGASKNIRIAHDLASLHSVAIQPDVRIISEVSQLPKVSSNDGATVVDVAKLLGPRTLIASFSGSPDATRQFHASYNGVGIRRFVRALAGASISKSEVEALIADILEDALVATYSHLSQEGSNIVVLEEDKEFILKTAIAERLPRVSDETAFAFAKKLIADLKQRIGDRGALAIDDGAVIYSGGRLSIVDVGDLPVRFGPNGEVVRRVEMTD